MKTNLISMSIIIMLALSSAIILFGIQAKADVPDWPTTWYPGETGEDPNENNIGDDYKDVRYSYYYIDPINPEYIFLRMEFYGQPDFDIYNDVRYKWFIDTNQSSELLLKGGKVYGAEYLLFVEDSPKPGGNGTVSTYLLEHNSSYTTGFPTSYEYITNPGPTSNLTAGWNITENNLSIYIRIQDIDNSINPIFTWACDQEDPNVASAPRQDRSDLFWNNSNTLYALNLSTNGTGFGTIQKSPWAPFYYYNDSVMLWANASVNSTFTGWYGNLSGTMSPETLVITDNMDVTAEFTLKGPYTLTLTASGTGSGTIEASSAGPYYYGDSVTIWANASVNSTFSAFNGSLVGSTSPQVLVFDGNEAVDAEFTLKGPYTLTLNTSGIGSGTIEASPAGPYYYGDNVTIWANASVRSKFTGFSDDLNGTTSPQVLIMNENKTVIADFSPSGGGGSGGGGGGEFIDEPPTAIINGPYFGTPNEEIQFDATESHDNDEDGQSIVRFDWKFSEDQEWQEDLGATPIYIYMQPGVYTVTLKVIDDESNYDTNTTTVTIIQPNIPPTIPGINGPNKGTVNISYNYTVVSTDEDGDELKYTIDWGDGTSNESEFLPSGESYNIYHKWTVAGTYTISVTADDGSTVSANDTTIKIIEPPKLKQKGFDYLLLLLFLLLFLILLLLILAKRRKDKKEEEQKPKGKPKSS